MVKRKVRTLDYIMEQYVFYALQQNNWNQRKTAEDLGRSRSWITLYLKDKRWCDIHYRQALIDKHGRGFISFFEDELPELLPIPSKTVSDK